VRADRTILAVLARRLPREQWVVFLVTSAMPLRWHRKLVARCWTYLLARRSRGLDPEVVEVVVQVARESPR